MNWALTIKKVSNGYVLEYPDDLDDETRTTRENIILVVEEQDREDGELEAAQKMLQEVKEYFGIYHSKHNKKNLVVKIEGGNDEG